MCRNWSKMGNEKVFFRSEHNYTSAPIAQLAACLTFFIWFWPDQTWPEWSQVQGHLEKNDFFSSFKLIFLSIFCMHLYHILINWSQNFWVVYVEYRFIYEQCESRHWIAQEFFYCITTSLNKELKSIGQHQLNKLLFLYVLLSGPDLCLKLCLQITMRSLFWYVLTSFAAT